MEKETYKNYDIIIEQDDIGESPREWDNIGKMVCFHSRYDLGDQKNISSDDFNGWDEMETYLKNECDAVIILPLFLYDHSGISMKTCPHGVHAGWDGGYVGFIYATREQIVKEYGCKKIGKNIKKKVEDILLNEVATYSDYLEGNVYSYRVEIDGERIDSCGGFYGYDNEKSGLMEDAKNAIDVNIEEVRKIQQDRVKKLIKSGVELAYR